MLALVCTLAQSDPAPVAAPELERTVALVLDAGDPSLAGRGPAERIEHLAGFMGTLHVWTRAEASFDLHLRVEDAQGQLLGEDDDAGGGNTPYLRLEVSPAQRIVVVVSLASAVPSGSCELHFQAARESADTLAAASAARADLARVRAARDAGDAAGARAAAELAIERLRPHAGASEQVSESLWLLGMEAYRQASLRSACSAWLPAHAHLARTRPRDHAGLQEVRIFLAETLRELGQIEQAWPLHESVLEVRTRTLHPDDPALQQARQALASTRKLRGDLPGARQLEELALEVYERTLPEDAEPLRRLRGALAGSLKAAGELHQARELEERGLAAALKAWPEDHPSVQLARSQLAVTLHALGDVERAQALVERVVEVYARIFPVDHPSAIQARGNLAVLLGERGDLDAARRLLEEVLALQSRTLPPEHADLANTRMSLANFLRQLGEPESARALQVAVLGELSRRLPPDHARLQQAYCNLGVTLFELGDLEGARALQEQVIEVRERVLPQDHPDLLSSLLNLSAVLREQGHAERAYELQTRLVEARARGLPWEHTDVQLARAALALTLGELGDLAGACAIESDVLEVLARRLPEDHPDLLNVRSNLANSRYRLGDLAGARVLQEQVLEARSRRLAADHPTLLGARLNMAAVLSAAQDLEAARSLEADVLARCERTLPPDHPLLNSARRNLGATLYALREFSASMRIHEQVFEALSQSLPADHPDLHTARLNQAACAFEQGELEQAGALLTEALDGLSRTLPAEHPHAQNARSALAATLLARAARARADPAADEWLAQAAVLLEALARLQVRAARESILTLAGREAEDRCASLSVKLDLVLSAGLGFEGLERLPALWPGAFTCSETIRNAALAADVRSVRDASAPEVAAARERWRAASRELARQIERGAEASEFRATLAEREQAERAFLALVGGRLPGRADALQLEHSSVARALGTGSVLVAFRAFDRWELGFEPGEQGRTGPRSSSRSQRQLCAFVVRGGDSRASDDSLTLVDLGALEPVRAAIEAWRAELGVAAGRGAGVASATAAGFEERALHELGARVLGPLWPALADARRIVVVLDDVLHLVPFDALPVPAEPAGPESRAPARRLADRFRVEVRATVRELLAEPRASGGSGTLLILGDPAFGEAPAKLADDEAASSAGGSVARPGTRAGVGYRGALSERGFAALPHSAEEARGLAEAHDATFPSVARSWLLTGRAATVEALEQLAPRARWLHVATHGWQAEPAVRSWLDREAQDPVSGSTLRLGLQEVVVGMSPMLLCGLVLTGADLPQAPEARAPGRISADELAALDLGNCELAVLSACDTARGELRRAGQGVASLQKALQIAGARSVITSLWKVPDAATKDLMLEFYRCVWVDKRPKGPALWAAKQKLRDARDAQGRPKYTLRDWGAWVLTGDPD